MRFHLLLLLILNCHLANSQSNIFNTSPKYIRFSPSKFYNVYDAATLPVLRIQPGDTVETESLDALGFDKDSVTNYPLRKLLS